MAPRNSVTGSQTPYTTTTSRKRKASRKRKRGRGVWDDWVVKNAEEGGKVKKRKRGGGTMDYLIEQDGRKRKRGGGGWFQDGMLNDSDYYQVGVPKVKRPKITGDMRSFDPNDDLQDEMPKVKKPFMRGRSTKNEPVKLPGSEFMNPGQMQGWLSSNPNNSREYARLNKEYADEWNRLNPNYEPEQVVYGGGKVSRVRNLLPSASQDMNNRRRTAVVTDVPDLKTDKKVREAIALLQANSPLDPQNKESLPNLPHHYNLIKKNIRGGLRGLHKPRAITKPAKKGGFVFTKLHNLLVDPDSDLHV